MSEQVEKVPSSTSPPTLTPAAGAVEECENKEAKKNNKRSFSGGLDAKKAKDVAAARHSIETEYNNKISTGWQRYYKEICSRCDQEAKDNNFTTLESERSQNRGLNRYRDVNPYDHSRIVLRRSKVDYINANLVKLERADRSYILTQGPLVDTVGHFWLMVWEQNTRGILMLNKLMEKKQIKCHLYWPESVGTENALKLKDVSLTVELIRIEAYQNFVRRWFKVTDLITQTSREVMQFHYTTWPDFGIPSSPDAFLKFLQIVRESGALSRDVGPAVVHCSAGIGRSGTFCLVDCCLVMIDKFGDCNVSQILCELRSYRMGLIQTADQLDFSYQAIIEGIRKLNDPTFLEAQEPLISNDTLHEELPPPLPPRTLSLQPNQVVLDNGTVGDKPSLLASKDALNNFINQHEIINAEVADSLTVSNRPLPPLPSRSLNCVAESDSDSDLDDDDDDDEDNVDEDDDEDYENIEDNEVKPPKKNDDVNANLDKKLVAENHNKSNGIEINQKPASPDNELKRRKRQEYQANLEQKVNDIKRKQRETEEKQTAAKKRRSLTKYIVVGVVVGVICAYAYTKLG